MCERKRFEGVKPQRATQRPPADCAQQHTPWMSRVRSWIPTSQSQTVFMAAATKFCKDRMSTPVPACEDASCERSSEPAANSTSGKWTKEVAVNTEALRMALEQAAEGGF